MATATKTTHALNHAADQIIQLNARLVDTRMRAGSVYLDSYEKLIENVTSFQQKLAEQSKNEAVRTAVATQVDLTRRVASAYTSAAREFLA